MSNASDSPMGNAQVSGNLRLPLSEGRWIEVSIEDVLRLIEGAIL